MNYYEHHIGDYAEATAHLSFVEDAAYSRLIRKYYATERPLPPELRQVQRLVGARTKEEREAVDAVLQEFFSLEADGWHQRRCDEVIREFHEKQAERAQEREAAAERQRRARERRAQLFEALRAHGLVPSFKTTTQDLEEMLSRVTTPSSHANVTPAPARDDTATQTPVTKHQSPIPSPQSPDASTVGKVVGAEAPNAAADAASTRGHRLPADWQLPKAWGDWALAEFPQWTPEKVRREGAAFRDHWCAKTGKDATKLDWLATWRNWCRSDIAHRDDPKPNGRGAAAAPVDTAARNAEAKRLLGFSTAEEAPHA